MKPSFRAWKKRISRSLFFFFDRLKVSRAERRTVSILSVLVVTTALLNWWIRPKPNYDPQEYAQLERLFQEKAVAAQVRQEAFLARFEGATEVDTGSDTTQNMAVDTLADSARFGAVDSPFDSTVGTSGSSPVIININTADAERLQRLPGIGPAYSERIIRWRTRYGPFTSKQQLLEINGIGPVRFARIRPLIEL